MTIEGEKEMRNGFYKFLIALTGILYSDAFLRYLDALEIMNKIFTFLYVLS